MARRDVSNITIEGAKIIWRNFSGEAGKFNRAGDRHFTVVIDDEEKAQDLINIGWNVRIKAPREEGDKPFFTLQVAVKFGDYPPRCVLVNNRGRQTILDEESIGCLDYGRLENADIVIRPYCFEVNGNEGIKAYLKTGYFTLEEDEFAYKYEQ